MTQKASGVALGLKRGVDRSRTAEDPKEWTNVLAEVPLFEGLGRRQLRKVASAARIARFHDHQIIMKSGEPGDSFHVLLDGSVTVERPGLPALDRKHGYFFGEMALLDGGPRTATVLAKEPVLSLVIARSRFLKVLRSEPSIAIAMIEELARRLRSAQAPESE